MKDKCLKCKYNSSDCSAKLSDLILLDGTLVWHCRKFKSNWLEDENRAFAAFVLCLSSVLNLCLFSMNALTFGVSIVLLTFGILLFPKNIYYLYYFYQQIKEYRW